MTLAKGVIKLFCHNYATISITLVKTKRKYTKNGVNYAKKVL